MLLRLVLGLTLFLGSMGLGWWLHRRGLLTDLRASQVVYWVVKVHAPIVLCLSFWKMNLRSAEPWLLPLLGTLISASTLVPAWLYARGVKLSEPEIGSFLNGALFSNVGYLGAFTAFALYGEAGYALCMLYLVFFTPCFYTLGFWLAGHYGRSTPRLSLGSALRGEPRLNPFIGMVIGALLSLSHVPRPGWLEPCNALLISLGTALYLMAIGAQLTIVSPRQWLGACLVMSGIKFLYTPLVAWGLLHIHTFHLTGLPRVIVLLQASTPVAVSPLILPMLFGLDRKLANALWLVTTCVAIPWLLLITPLLARL